MKKKLLCCISGGKTSGYMAKILHDKYMDDYEIVFVFANTSFENDQTLDFMNDIQCIMGINVVWVEADVLYRGHSSRHKITNYQDAKRKGEVFESVVKKYGVPNKTYPHCTRELKENPIHSYIASIGWKKGDYETAIGIRTDEMQRVKRGKSPQNKVYPLVDWFPSDKEDVDLFWEDQAFNLKLNPYEGNCKTCFKKSEKKLNLIYRESPEKFDFFDMLERNYGHVGPNKMVTEGFATKRVELVDTPRAFWRGYKTTPQLIASFDLSCEIKIREEDEDSACGKSCDPFAD